MDAIHDQVEGYILLAEFEMPAWVALVELDGFVSFVVVQMFDHFWI